MTTTWEQLSETELLPEEEVTLTKLLTAMLAHGDNTSVASAVGYSDKQKSATNVLYTVTLLSSEGTVVGTAYTHPGRYSVGVHRVGQPKTEEMADYERQLAAFQAEEEATHPA